MADDRYRTRPTERPRVRPRSTPLPPSTGGAASNRDETRTSDETHTNASPPLKTRRSLWAAAVAVAVAAGIYLLSSGGSQLPLPSGQNAEPKYLAVTLQKQPAPTVPMPPDRTSWPSCGVSAPVQTRQDLDLVFAIDTTGSMGNVINDLKANVAQLIASLRTGGGSVRVGVVAYRDRGDAYVTLPFPLTPLDDSAGVARLQAFIAGLQASGGGDWPEAVDAALETAVSMAWRGDVPSTIVVLGDAPAHDQGKARDYAKKFSASIPGGRVSVIDTGSGGDPFLRGLPGGGGQYVTYNGHILHSLLPALTGCPSK